MVRTDHASEPCGKVMADMLTYVGAGYNTFDLADHYGAAARVAESSCAAQHALLRVSAACGGACGVPISSGARQQARPRTSSAPSASGDDDIFSTTTQLPYSLLKIMRGV